MNILFSIKPCFVEKILSGEKLYEYRKHRPNKQNQLEWAFIYSCAPQKRIVAAFLFQEIVVGTPNNIWEKTKDYSGINEADFHRYYANSIVAYAIAIHNLRIFESHINPWQIDRDFRPPQSFAYLKGDLHEKLCNLVR